MLPSYTHTRQRGDFTVRQPRVSRRFIPLAWSTHSPLIRLQSMSLTIRKPLINVLACWNIEQSEALSVLKTTKTRVKVCEDFLHWSSTWRRGLSESVDVIRRRASQTIKCLGRRHGGGRCSACSFRSVVELDCPNGRPRSAPHALRVSA